MRTPSASNRKPRRKGAEHVIGMNAEEARLRRQCIEGTAKYAAALRAAGYLSEGKAA
jgi:hypothetical protein